MPMSGYVASLFSFPHLVKNMCCCLAPVGFKGHRFHYWKYGVYFFPGDEQENGCAQAASPKPQGKAKHAVLFRRLCVFKHGTPHVGIPNGFSGQPADQIGLNKSLKCKSHEAFHCMTQIWKHVKLQQYYIFRTRLQPPNDHRRPISDHLPTTLRPLRTTSRPPRDHLPTTQGHSDGEQAQNMPMSPFGATFKEKWG